MLREDKLIYAEICYKTMVDSYDLIENHFDTACPMKHWTNWIMKILDDRGVMNDYALCRSLFDISMKEFQRFFRIESNRKPLLYKIDINMREGLHDDYIVDA